MAIETLYRDYIQKSRLFLFPILNIERGGSVTPIETYISWKDHYGPTDYKLICLYHLRDDAEFRAFERLKLLGNSKFHDFKQLKDNKGLYIFDLSNHKEDWDKVVSGQYSKLSEPHKKRIQEFFGNAGTSYPYIESYLYPEKYHAMYAEILSERKDRKEMEESLRYVNELCDKPSWELEQLEITVKDLEITNQMS